jgi:hypothetical protein
MPKRLAPDLDRRSFFALGVRGAALAAVPSWLSSASTLALADEGDDRIEAVIRPETLFAGIRKPLSDWRQLEPRIGELESTCGDRIAGPLTHILRFDTPVEGMDSEIGFPVSAPVDGGEVRSHTLRRMHFYSKLHRGDSDTLRETSRELYRYMATTGLSPELELVHVHEHRDLEQPQRSRTRVMAAFLAWPELYREQLVRVLGSIDAESVWRGGEMLTPHTGVDDRSDWVARSIARLKEITTVDQQFEILSRVALVRPAEDVEQSRRLFEEKGRDVEAMLEAQHAKLSKTRTGGFVDPPRFDGRVLHLSKVPYNGKAYLAAKTATERRRAYCFCNLVREATDPQIDPIFCYRAAGWARQLWEPILGVEFKSCTIIHSILKGDAFCAWDFHVPSA